MKISVNEKNLGEAIDRIRYYEKKTEQELAEYLNTGQQTINKRIRGFLRWHLESVIKLSELLGYKIEIEKGSMIIHHNVFNNEKEIELMKDKFKELEENQVNIKKVMDFGKYSIIEIYSNTLNGTYGNIFTSLDEAIVERLELLKDDSISTNMLVGYCLYDNETNYSPDDARDWHDTVKSAEREYRDFYEVRREYNFYNIRRSIVDILDENINDIAIEHLSCFSERYYGNNLDMIEYDLNVNYDISSEYEWVEDKLDIKLTSYEETYIANRFIKEVCDCFRKGFKL